MPSHQPFLHTTPAEALGEPRYQTVKVGTSTFRIAYPGNADAILDHPSTHEAFGADEYMPYWAELWPAAHMLAETLLTEDLSQFDPQERDLESRNPDTPNPESRNPENRNPDTPNPEVRSNCALEIGCGVGLPGIVALSLGLRVIFSDYDVTAVEFAARNARANGFDNFETLPLDWRVPPSFQVPLLLAADVIYEERNIEPLISLIQTVLTPEGFCLLSDPDRPTNGGFRFALKQAQLKFTRSPMSAPGPEGKNVQGSVYRIWR
jgi:SAM-dependent methyltransferase